MSIIFENIFLDNVEYTSTETIALNIYETDGKKHIFSFFSKIPIEKIKYKDNEYAVIPVLKSNQRIISIHPNILKIKMTQRVSYRKIIEMSHRVMNLNGYTYLEFHHDVNIIDIKKKCDCFCEYVHSTDIFVEQYEHNLKYWQYGENK